MRKEVVDRFQQKFDELNIVATEIQIADSKQAATDIFDEILVDAYVEGYAGIKYLFGVSEMSIDESELKHAIQKEYDGVSIKERMRDHYESGNVGEIKNLLDSEYHRVYTQAQIEAAQRVGAQTKKWLTVMDDKVRETHKYLEGVEIPIDAEFYTFDGDKAQAPGGFEKAQNNAHCRCILDFTA